MPTFITVLISLYLLIPSAFASDDTVSLTKHFSHLEAIIARASANGAQLQARLDQISALVNEVTTILGPEKKQSWPVHWYGMDYANRQQLYEQSLVLAFSLHEQDRAIKESNRQMAQLRSRRDAIRWKLDGLMHNGQVSTDD